MFFEVSALIYSKSVPQIASKTLKPQKNLSTSFTTAHSYRDKRSAGALLIERGGGKIVGKVRQQAGNGMISGRVQEI